MTLDGLPVSGETWTVRLGDLSYGVTVTVETLEEIADALATAINADAGAFTAMAEGRTLVVVNRAGAAFETQFEITPNHAFEIDDTTATTIVATLDGVPVAGETWSVVLTADGAPAAVFAYVVDDSDGTADTLAEVAAALASAIGASGILRPPPRGTY